MVTTHYLDEAEHCNQLAFIYGGRIIANGAPAALKRGPNAGITLEIVSNANVALLDPIEDLPFVRSASLFGSALHVTVADDADAARLEAFLGAQGVDVPAARIAPSLEDVFAGLVGAPS
jgi:ABC-2 type transport system ATP-binding protein